MPGVETPTTRIVQQGSVRVKLCSDNSGGPSVGRALRERMQKPFMQEMQQQGSETFVLSCIYVTQEFLGIFKNLVLGE